MVFFSRRRIRRPVQGHAVVVETTPPPRRVIGAGGGSCRMRLRLEVPGIPPLLIEHSELTKVNRWPEVGMRVAVTVDADHPDRLEAHWDSVFGTMRGGILGHGAEMLAGAAGLDIELSRGLEPDPGREGMSVEQFTAYAAELNAEFAAGRITYEEMAARMQRASGM